MSEVSDADILRAAAGIPVTKRGGAGTNPGPDATDEEILRAADRVANPPLGEPASDLGGPRQLAEGLQSGLLKGMSAATGFAEDIPGWALEAAGVELPLQLGPYAHIGKPGHAERRNRRLAEEGKIYPGRAPTTMGRIGERGGEVASVMIPFASGLRAASTALPVYESAKALPTLSNVITQPWRAEKAGQLLREMGIGLQFGLGGGVLEETLPEDMPGRQGVVLAGEVASPAVGTGIAKATKTLGRRIAQADPSKLSDVPRAAADFGKWLASGTQKLATGESAAVSLARKQEADALDVAAAEFRAASEKSPGAVLRDIREYRALRQDHPGVELPIAKVTGEEGGLRTQARDLSHYNTKFSGELKAARERTEQALQAELRATAPNQSAGAQRVAQLVEKTNAREMEALDMLVAEAGARAEAEVAAAGGQVEPVEAATRAAQLINETVTPYMRARQKELYDDIPEVMLSTARLKGAVKTQFEKLSPFMRESVGDVPIVKRIEKLPDEIPFSEFQDVRKVLNNDIDKISGGGNLDKTVRGVLLDTKDATRGILDEMMLNNTDAVAASRYDVANRYTHDALEHLQDYAAGGRVTGLGAGKQVPASSALKQYAHIGDGAKEDAQAWNELLEWMRKTEVRGQPLGRMTPEEYARRNPHDAGAGGNAWRDFDALPGESEVWVFHATDSVSADRMLRSGVSQKAKPATRSRVDYEAGRGESFGPREGLGGGLYVGSSPVGVEGHGKRILAIRVPKGRVSVPPEGVKATSASGPGAPPRTPGRALSDSDAQILGDVGAGDIFDVTKAGRYIRGHEALSGSTRTMSAEADQLSRHMEDYLISDAFKSSGIANNSPKVAENLASWVKARRPMLEQFPEIRLKLSNTESAKRLFAERVQARDVAAKDFEKSLASDFLNQPVDTAIDAALRPAARHGKDPGKALRNLLTRAGGSPEAQDGIARALWDRMMRDAFREELEAGPITTAVENTPEILYPANFLRFLSRYQNVLGKWWKPSHIERLKGIGVLANRNRVKLEAATSRPQTPQSDAFLSNAKYYNRPASKLSNTLITGGSPTARGVATFLDYMFEAFPARAVVEHLEKAHLPGGDAHAELLLRHVTPEQAAALLRRFRPGRIVGALPTDDRGKEQRRFPQ